MTCQNFHTCKNLRLLKILGPFPNTTYLYPARLTALWSGWALGGHPGYLDYAKEPIRLGGAPPRPLPRTGTMDFARFPNFQKLSISEICKNSVFAKFLKNTKTQKRVFVFFRIWNFANVTNHYLTKPPPRFSFG